MRRTKHGEETMLEKSTKIDSNMEMRALELDGMVSYNCR